MSRGPSIARGGPIPGGGPKLLLELDLGAILVGFNVPRFNARLMAARWADEANFWCEKDGRILRKVVELRFNGKKVAVP